MKGNEVYVELLLGRKAVDIEGRPVGRIEEIEAEIRGTGCQVREYHLGSTALFERFSAWALAHTILKVLPHRKRPGGYRVPWDKMDLGDPAHPRVLLRADELQRLED